MNNIRYAVIGNPIAHSLSPVIHQLFALQTELSLSYEKIKGEDENFEQQVLAFFAANGKGLNVTLPYKHRAAALAKRQTPRCQKAQAANTLYMQQGQLMADNTDGIGLVRDLTHYLTLTGARILILGAGGAARGIIAPMLEQNPKVLMLANRTFEKAQALQSEFPTIECADIDTLDGNYDLIINATSASLVGKTVPIPHSCFENNPFCYDLAYLVQQPTAFITDANKRNCQAVDGLGMLVEQAAEAFSIWNQVMPNTKPVLELLRSEKIHDFLG